MQPDRTSGEPERGWASVVCLAGIGVGAALIVAGVLWPRMTSDESLWTVEQAREFQAASDALHAASRNPRDARPGPADEEGELVDAEIAAARERFAQIQAELAKARYAREEVGPLLTRIGLAAAIAFGIGYWISRGG